MGGSLYRTVTRPQSTERHFNWRNFFVTYFISYGQLCFGYPSSIISTTLGSPGFLKYMGLVNADGMATASQENIVGTTNGLYQAGAFVNTWITCYLLEKIGRKNTVYYNCVVGLLGGALLCGARDISMFLAGRWFTGMSAWGFLILTPVYTSELSPPDLRGFYTGLNGVHIGLGYFLAASMGRAWLDASSPDAVWRGPLGIYLFFPLLLIVIMFFSPESPRWLMLKGRHEEAEKVIYRLHTVNGNTDFAERELAEMKKQIAIDVTLETSWISMFRKPSYRKRTLICMWYCFIGQSTAILVINNYGPTFYKGLGYGTVEQIDFQLGWVALAPPFCLLGALLLDRIGRKPLLLFGVAGCVVWLSVEAAATACFTEHPTKLACGKLGVAALYMFNACYNVGVDVGGNVFYAEAFPNHIRHKGVSITNAVLALSDLVYLEVTPIAFSNIGWKFFMVFISISTVGFITLLYLLPETKGLSLEQVGKIFGDEEEAALYREDVDVATGKLGQNGSGDHSGDEVGDIEKGTGVERHVEQRQE